MVKRGHLNVPVIGVAKAGWNLDQLRTRAKDSSREARIDILNGIQQLKFPLR